MKKKNKGKGGKERGKEDKKKRKAGN